MACSISQGPFENGAKINLKLTNPLNSPTIIRFYIADFGGRIRKTPINRYFDLEGPLSGSHNIFLDFDAGPNAVINIVGTHYFYLISFSTSRLSRFTHRSVTMGSLDASKP